jgi:hypothetical protein
MGGLTLVLLNWTLGLRIDERTPAALPADRPLHATMSRGAGRFAVVRHGKTWFAVKLTRSEQGRAARDLRSDSGLAFALTRSAGRWRGLVPQRPRNGERPPRTAGPVLLGKGAGYFYGDSIRARRDGSVHVRGEFRRGAGRAPRATTIVYRALRCGVELRFRARRATGYRLSAFFSRRPQITPTAAGDGAQLVVASASRSSIKRVPGTLASAEHARLRRVDFKLHATTTRRIGLRFTAARCSR